MELTERQIEEWVFWWFCFLELNEDYFEYCEAMAANDLDAAREVEKFTNLNLADMYKDWGVLWSISFYDTSDPAWKAWFEPRRHLFIDQVVTESVSVVTNATTYNPQAGHVLLDIPLAMTRNDIEGQVRELLKDYRRTDYKPTVTPAKYQLYTRGTRGEGFSQMVHAYQTFTNNDAATEENIAKYVAEFGMGAFDDVGIKMKTLLLGRAANTLDTLEQLRLKPQMKSYKNSYERFWQIGSEYSSTVLTGLFPCKLSWCDEEMAKK